MKTTIAPSRFASSIDLRSVSRAAFALVAAAVLTEASAQFPNLPVAPLTLQGIGDPNIIVTIDDSGSMTQDAVPDNKGCDGSGRRLSARWNKLAYNPFTIYEAPYDPDLMDGTRISSPFAAARINGYSSTDGTENLAATYRSHCRYSQGVGAGSANYGTNGRATFDDTTLVRNGQLVFPVERAYFYSYYQDLGVGLTVPNPGQDPATFVRNTVVPANCTAGDVNDRDCYLKTTVPVGLAHEQNFANWFSFYRTRTFVTITGANLAFFNLPKNYRVTWQGLNTCRGFNSDSCNGWDGATYKNVIRSLNDSAHRKNFFKWLSKIQGGGGTPLVASMERAGEFYRTTGIDSPIANQPGVAVDGPGTSPINACRPNYHILMTDGKWNGGNGSLGERDSNSITFPDGVVYSAQSPYAGAGSGNLADVAFYYWANDLQPTVPNNVLRYYAGSDISYFNPRNDPASWQHMVNFTVGLGLSEFLNGSSGNLLFVPGTSSEAASAGTYKGSYANLVSGATAWPTPSDNSDNNISDLWHAALNSRGYFFSAESPGIVRRAFEEIISRIGAGQTSSGQRGVAAGRTGVAGNLAFTLKYDAGTWSGTLDATNIRRDGALGALAWSTDTTLVNDVGRTILTWDAANSVGRAFAWTAFTPTEQASLFNDNQNLFNWIRGDRSNEGSPFRTRTQLLGDVIGSDLVISGKRDYGYSVLSGTPGTSYSTYVNKKETVAFVGANDGFLHAFRKNGTEAFAYAPSSVLPKLKLLANDPYIHQTMVDGPLALWDYYSSGAWKTILVGGLGGGGRTFFGLDVTNLVTSPSGTVSASNILFELNDPDIGYTFTRPLVARQPNGEWVAIFGNGYGGASHKAQLIVRNLSTGAQTKIDTGAGTDVLPNGLSSPSGLSFQSGTINGVYAGDYRGNLWRFQVSSTGVWSVANSGNPLFVAKDSAGNRQPITAAPTLLKHPGGGVMVLFGTGKFFEVEDRTDTRVQSFYGVRDVGTAIAGRSDLVQQTIVTGQNIAVALRSVSENAVDFKTKRGWFIDFNTIDGAAATGEKIVASAILLAESVVFNTFIPARTACEGIGTGFMMGLNAFTGSLPKPIFDQNNDGLINSADLVGGKTVAGSRLGGDGSLASPVAQLVTVRPGPGANTGTATAGSCGRAGQAPCSPGGCVQPQFILNSATNLCVPSQCPEGAVVVNNNRCNITDRTARWMELR
jgi:type IV pilus assembly protein PilY1